MAKNQPPEFVTMLLTRYTPGFGEPDFTIRLESPYDITTQLQAIQQEAGAKGCAVIINVSLIPSEELFTSALDESEETENDEPE